MPSTVYTGTASGGHYEPMESPFTLVMVTSRLKSRLMSVRTALCSQCFSILLWTESCNAPQGLSLQGDMLLVFVACAQPPLPSKKESTFVSGGAAVHKLA